MNMRRIAPGAIRMVDRSFPPHAAGRFPGRGVPGRSVALPVGATRGAPDDAGRSIGDAAGDDFDRLFVAPRVLELTDESDGSGKLLGVQVEMKYEDE